MIEKKQYLFDDFGQSNLVVQHRVTHGIKTPIRHLHSQYEFLFIRKGHVLIENNADSLMVDGPCLIVHQPFSLHSANVSEDCLYDRYVINCAPHCLAKLQPLIPDSDPLFNGHFSVWKLSAETELLFTEYYTKIATYVSSEMYDIALLYLAILLTQLTAHSQASLLIERHAKPYIADVITYITLNYAEDIRIEHLAERAYVSRSKLIADFKETAGVSIKQFLMLVRVCNAQRFLAEGKSITEASQLCGFCDSSHMINTFRQLTGATPKTFMEHLKR